MAQDPLAAIVIRRSTLADLESARSCLDIVARERRWLGLLEAPTIEQMRTYLTTTHVIHLVAMNRDLVAGWCDVMPKPHEGMRHRGKLGMGLLPDHRGRGLGRRLLEETLRTARDAGITRVELEVFASNTAAIKLYQRLGFVHEGRKRAARILDGRTEDTLCMGLVDSPREADLPRDTPPDLSTEFRLRHVLDELIAREPIFHRLELGTTRRGFENMVEPDFWEVGASGRRYSREYVLDRLEERHRTQREDRWQTRGFQCRELAPDNYLLTYTLDQEGRITRRSTIWRRREGEWRIVYHQGTLVDEEQ